MSKKEPDDMQRIESVKGVDYSFDYAKKYIERTLGSFYTINKNLLIARILRSLDVESVLDLGCNVGAMLKVPGSLRFQLEAVGINNFVGVDLHSAYFDKDFALSLGVGRNQLNEITLGIVGDMQDLKIGIESIECVVCADVIEHIPNPEKAIAEAFRVLKPGGVAVFVVPSMYKLDVLSLDQIDEIRKSTHENKKTIDEWKVMLVTAGFEIDNSNSQPIGLASGLSYLSWLIDDYVSRRVDVNGEDEYSRNSLLHKSAKEVLSKHDLTLGALLGSEDITKQIIDLLSQGKVADVLNILLSVCQKVGIKWEELLVVRRFVESVTADVGLIERSKLENLKRLIKNTQFPSLILGNSCLVVLRKPNKR